MKMRKKERGIVLLMVLFVVIILGILIQQMGVTTLNTTKISQNYLYDLQNTFGCRSGYHQALLYLEADTEKEPNIDSLGEKWAGEISFHLLKDETAEEEDSGGVSVMVTIEDSERRINLSQINKDDEDKTLNEAVAEQFRQLLFVLGHPADIAERVIDYIDTDTQGNYESGARNDRLYTLQELLQIEGVPTESLYGGKLGGQNVVGFLDFVTIYPRTLEEGETAGKININTAPSAVLQSLSENITPLIADEIDLYRSTETESMSLQSFESPDDLKNVSGITEEIYNEISDYIQVNASHFEIRVRSRHSNMTKNWLYVVKRSKEGEGEEATHALSLVLSQKTSDFLTTPPPEEEEED